MEEAMPRVWKWNIKAWLQYRCCFSFSAVGLVVMIMLMSKMFLILLYWSWVVTMRQVAAMAAAPKVAAWSWTYLGDEHTGESRVDRGDLCLTWVKVKVFVLSFYLSERARQSPTKTSSVPPWHSPGHHDQLWMVIRAKTYHHQWHRTTVVQIFNLTLVSFCATGGWQDCAFPRIRWHRV